MKKKTKIIILVSILLVITILILIINEIHKYNIYIGTIEYIENNYIQVCIPIDRVCYFSEQQTPIYDKEGNQIDFSHINVGEYIYITEGTNNTKQGGIIKNIENKLVTFQYTDSYTLSAKDTLIKDSNGNRINVSELNVGDIIYIVNKEPKINARFGSLEDVKLIKVLDNTVYEIAN